MSQSSPFTDAQQSIFLQAFEDVVKEGIIPPGYGMLPKEWEDGEYPSIEIIRAGHSRNDLHVALPDDMWRPCTLIWVQALHIMQQLQYRFGL